MRLTLYPTTIIAGPDGRVYAFLAGYQTSDHFLEHAGKALSLLPESVGNQKPHDRSATLTKNVQTGVETGGASSQRPSPSDGSGDTQTARELLSAAKAAFASSQFAVCLDHADTLRLTHPNSLEAGEVAGVVAAITKDAEKLSAAYQQFDERTAAGYYMIGNSLALAGRLSEAVTAFEKSLRISPSGKRANNTVPASPNCMTCNTRHERATETDAHRTPKRPGLLGGIGVVPVDLPSGLGNPRPIA